MRIVEVRNALLGITTQYFSGATVAWGQTNMTKPQLPFITMMLGDVNRSLKPIRGVLDGVPTYYYPASVRWTINLFTRGAQIKQNESVVAREDTSESDLLGFVNFTNSDYFIGWEHENGLYIRPEGTVRNLSALTNDVNWEYRAMAEFVVAFTERTAGSAAVWLESSIKQQTVVEEWEQTASGGGSMFLADYSDGYFDHVNLEYKNDPTKNEGG